MWPWCKRRRSAAPPAAQPGRGLSVLDDFFPVLRTGFRGAEYSACSAHSPALAILFAAVFGAGLLLAVALPPLAAPDELYHWQRTVQIAQGKLLPDEVGEREWGGKIDKAAHDYFSWAYQPLTRAIPVGMSEALRVATQMQTESGRRVAAAFPSTASFSPLAYVPQAVGVAAARAVGANVLVQILAGRIANLAVYLGVVALTLRVLPLGRLTFLAVAFVPTALHLAGSLNADPLNFAIPALLSAWCLRLRVDAAAALTPRALRLLALLAAALGLLKPTCWPLSAIVAIIPAERFGSRRAKRVFVAACIAVAALVGLAWNLSYPFVPGVYWRTGADPQATVAAIFRDPAAAVESLFGTIRQWWRYWGVDGYGRFGGSMPPSPYVLYTSPTIAWAALYSIPLLAATERAPRRDLPAAALLAALGIGLGGIVLVAFRVAYTAPGAELIAGVQGRYFHLTVLLLAWGIVCAAPVGGLLSRLRVPAFALVVVCHALTVGAALDHYRFYWSN
jgi:hypothetical protein